MHEHCMNPIRYESQRITRVAKQYTIHNTQHTIQSERKEMRKSISNASDCISYPSKTKDEPIDKKVAHLEFSWLELSLKLHRRRQNHGMYKMVVRCVLVFPIRGRHGMQTRHRGFMLRTAGRGRIGKEGHDCRLECVLFSQWKFVFVVCLQTWMTEWMNLWWLIPLDCQLQRSFNRRKLLT